RVKEIAAEKTKKARVESPPPRRDVPPRSNYDEERRNPSKDAKSLIDKRKDDLDDATRDRVANNDNFNRAQHDVVKSSIPADSLIRFSPDHAEKMRKRGSTIKMTAKEKAIMESLNKTIEVDFGGASLTDVLDFLKKKTGIEIAADKRGLD